jgi:hypothetical protein
MLLPFVILECSRFLDWWHAENTLNFSFVLKHSLQLCSSTNLLHVIMDSCKWSWLHYRNFHEKLFLTSYMNAGFWNLCCKSCVIIQTFFNTIWDLNTILLVSQVSHTQNSPNRNIVQVSFTYWKFVVTFALIYWCLSPWFCRVVHTLSHNFRNATRLDRVRLRLPIEPQNVLVKIIYAGVNASDVSPWICVS